MSIPIQYEIKVFNRKRSLNLIWETLLVFDFSNRGFFIYKTIHNFKYFKDDTIWLHCVYSNLKSEYGFLNLSIIILAGIQICLILKRLYEGLLALSKLKLRLNKITFIEDDDETSSFKNLEINFHINIQNQICLFLRT